MHPELTTSLHLYCRQSVWVNVYILVRTDAIINSSVSKSTIWILLYTDQQQRRCKGRKEKAVSQ